MENNEKIWLCSVTPDNWDTVITKKIWAVDVEQKAEKISKNDTIIFYVSKSNCFRGIFKTVSDWHKPTTAWPDGRKTVCEIDLEAIEMGYASTRKLSEQLQFVTEYSKIGAVLISNKYGPANFGRPLDRKDYETILAELKKTKSPDPINKYESDIDAPEDYDSRLIDSPVRLHLVKKLFENLLGPRNGPGEEIEDISAEYIVGVLRTQFNKPELYVADDPSYHVARQHIKDDDSITHDTDDDVVSPDYDHNPMLGARSMGLSFIISGDKPKIKACFTWGRYETGVRKNLYRRKMNYFATEIDITNPSQTFKPEVHPSTEKRITKPGARIEVISKKIPEFKDRFHVSVFLINNTVFAGEHQMNTDHIFQPQIRVKCLGNAELQDMDYGMEDDPANNDVIYEGRGNRGKGHFCGTVWHDVDPEDYGKEGFATFSWPDSKSKHFPDDLAKYFTRPDIRTEFFPTYSILHPKLDKKKGMFDAETLSNTWQSDELSRKLEGIVDDYGKWIDSQSVKLVESAMPETARRNLDKCERSKQRIRDGIEFLKSDEKARLAFCFMNKVMSLKSEWDEVIEPFSWHEFQLAFILQCLRGTVQQNESERDICDILWFPTGGGKTEAYLGISLFTIAFRRLEDHEGFSTDGGVSVISRYTLRLLTIQQFQRAVGVVTVAEYLRVTKWIPKGLCIASASTKKRMDSGKLWGSSRISVGLFIGNSATPSRFKDKINYSQAESILSDKSDRLTNPSGEPSQILSCPCCKTLLAIPLSEKMLFDKVAKTVSWIFYTTCDLKTLLAIPHENFSGESFGVRRGGVSIKQVGDMPGPANSLFYELKIIFYKRHQNLTITGEDLKRWWDIHISKVLPAGLKIASTSPARPGYFYLKANGKRHDFAIFCPNSDCQLNSKIWSEKITDGPVPTIPRPFMIKDNPSCSSSIPIPAFTTDEQVYRRCPSMIISTVDKFAMMPFKEDIASLFGNIDEYDEILGYGRSNITQYADNDDDLHNRHPARRLLPPSLVIQDELHLIEGPLGSLVGSYEMAFDILSTSKQFQPKYIASSATIKEAENQVKTIYRRNSFVFPPPGVSVDDNYFVKNEEDRPSKSDKSGRLYLGVCAPQKILTLPVRIWSVLLAETYLIRKYPKNYGLYTWFERRPQSKLGMTFEEFIADITDPYWTLVGYFNAIKELQISRSLYDDDIRRDVKKISCENITSILFQESSLKLKRGLRFFPVDVDRDMEITRLTIHCDNSKGRICAKIFGNSNNTTPQYSDEIKIKSEDVVKNCTPGENEFVLKDPRSVQKGDLMWVAVANDDDGTRFETGKGFIPPLFADTTESEMNEIFNNQILPQNLVLHQEKFTIRVTLSSEPRTLGPEPLELTGSTESQDLPNVLKILNKKPNNNTDAVFTTSVFGTGVDIPRLGLMTVMGQPKTTSSYIQSTGRVGRNNPGLVVSWYRATNIRDLNHYENFVGYHRMLQRYVEPISAYPFSEDALVLCLGPILVSILRNCDAVNAFDIPKEWVGSDTGPMRIKSKYEDAEKVGLEIIKRMLDSRIPETRKISEEHARRLMDSVISGWKKDARNLSNDGANLLYFEWTIRKIPKNNVVLGTPQHEIEQKTTVFKNTRTSMREVESTANFGGN